MAARDGEALRKYLILQRGYEDIFREHTASGLSRLADGNVSHLEKVDRDA